MVDVFLLLFWILHVFRWIWLYIYAWVAQSQVNSWFYHLIQLNLLCRRQIIDLTINIFRHIRICLSFFIFEYVFFSSRIEWIPYCVDDTRITHRILMILSEDLEGVFCACVPSNSSYSWRKKTRKNSTIFSHYIIIVCMRSSYISFLFSYFTFYLGFL